MILVLQHEPGEGLGSLAPLVPNARFVHTHASDAVPREPGDAELVIVLGGGMAAYDPLPHIAAEIALLQACVRKGTPVFGICLGAQLLAAALGARVFASGRQEIGFYRVTPTAPDEVLPQESFVTFHWHGDVFDLPEGATALARSTLTPLQAFRHGPRFYGVQFHPEVDDAQLRTMLTGLDADTAGLIAAQAPRELPRMREQAHAMFARFTSRLR